MIRLEAILEGLPGPVALAYSEFEPHYIYVADQTGLIYRYDTVEVTVSQFADFRSLMDPVNEEYDERGLLGLVFSPYNPDLYYVFLSLARNSDKGTNNRTTATLSKDGKLWNVVLEVSRQNSQRRRTILTIPCTETFHNGGGLIFGPQGYLYIGIGDGGPQEDPAGRAQDLQSLHGKIVRIDVRTVDAEPEIWAWGFRNPWGLSRYGKEQLLVADVGYKSVEEIDLVSAGFNGGWNYYEGTMRTPWTKSEGPFAYDSPVYEYAHSGLDLGMDSVGPNALKRNTCSVIGGYYLSDLGSLPGGYVCGDYCGELYIIQELDGKWQRVYRQEIDYYVRAFGQDYEDNLYVLVSKEPGTRGTTGSVMRLHF